MKTITTKNLDRYEALETLINSLKAEQEAIKDEISAEMKAEGIDQFEAEDGRIVRYTEVLSSRLDTKKVKEIIGKQVYASLCKEVHSHRFTVSHA